MKKIWYKLARGSAPPSCGEKREGEPLQGQDPTPPLISMVIYSGLKESVKINKFIAVNANLVVKASELIINSYQSGGKVVLFGNGGSASDAEHIAAEFMGHFIKNRKPLSAIALTSNSSLITAIANDDGYENIFSRQVEALVNKNDTVIAISTSGLSANVIQAAQKAYMIGAKLIWLTGSANFHKGDLIISIPSNNTPRIQEAHILIGHLICELVEQYV